MRALPSEIAQAEAALAAAQRQSAQLSAAAPGPLRTHLRTHGWSAISIPIIRRAARFRVQLDARLRRRNRPQPSSTRFNSLRRKGDRLESEEYASLERTEAHEAALSQSRAQVEQLATEVESVRARVAARQQELAAKLAALDGERDAVRAAIEPEWLARFDRLAKGRGTGIARAENQQCTGCSMPSAPASVEPASRG